MEFDVAVIGAGITGAAIARELSMTHLSVALIDAAEDVAMGASRANSAIVHAGYDCEPGTLMAELNVRGNRLFTQWCQDLQVPLSRTGSLVIGFDDADKQKIEQLYERGKQNKVPDMEIINGNRALEIEPALNPDVKWALLAKTAGITCPYQLTIACAENARANGAKWLLGSGVTRIDQDQGALILHLQDRQSIRARYVVNAAGVFADEVAHMVGDRSFQIKPRKGEYLLLDKGAAQVYTVIFQTPSHLGKGILVSPTVDGNCFAGPTALEGIEKTDTSTTQQGIDEASCMALRSVPNLNLRAAITAFSGVRAQPSTGDFIIRSSEVEPRLIHAAGICSPGLTSAPAIAEKVRAMLGEMGEDVTTRKEANPSREAIRELRHMTPEDRQQAIAKNSLYGRVICRCETITEAEIVEAIRRGARSVDAVKRRTRAGMGRCQGGFCGPRVMEILARELHVPMHEVTKSGPGSWMVLPGDTCETEVLSK